MKSTTYLFAILLFLFTFTGCKKKESNTATQPRVNIHLPVHSANVVFHIKDNKVTSYEILNEDGSAMNDQLIYRQVSEAGDEKCYRCPAGETDTKKCTEITCPRDPCKDIACGPLKFEIYDDGTPTKPENVTRFSVIADGIKK